MKVPRHKQQSVIAQVLAQQKGKSIREVHSDELSVITFRHLDEKQGATLREWDEKGILSPAIETLAHICGHKISTLAKDHGKKFSIYGDFPPPDKTDFKHPVSVPEDANWARIHVDGKQCVIGHTHRNTFYVVFLDTEHRFWKVEK